MRNPVYRRQWMIVLTSIVFAGMPVASGETFPAFFAEPHPGLSGQTLSASGVCPGNASRRRRGHRYNQGHLRLED